MSEQFEKKNLLFSLITTYPSFLLKKFDIKKEKIKSFPIKEIIERIFLKLKLHKYLNKIYFYLNLFFENYASRKIDIKKINVLVSWSGSAEKSFLRINKYNNRIIKILERGSSHISFQNEILLEEYNLFSLKKKNIDIKIMDKEIREYSLADYIALPSNFARETFLKYNIDEKKIIKVPYGVDLKLFQKAPLDNKVFTIISVGTVSLRKGSYYLMKAFKELNLKNSKLIFVGGIDPEVNEIIKPYTYENNIQFVGHVAQSKLKNYYNISHVAVIFSIEEGMALVQPQAMASGLPLICTTNSGGSEIVDDNENGFICEIRNIEQLKEKIMFFYDNREMINKFGDNAYYKAQRNLSWEKYGDNLEKIYLDLFKQTREY